MYKRQDQVNKDTSGLWFFNSSPEAGASQPHRHIQLLRRSLNEKVCPREDWLEHLISHNKHSTKLEQNVTVLKLSTNLTSKQEYYSKYLKLVSLQNLGSPIHQDVPKLPYNLLISNKWIAIITRSTENFKGFNINALGFAGYILIKENSNIDWLNRKSPKELLENVVAK